MMKKDKADMLFPPVQLSWKSIFTKYTQYQVKIDFQNDHEH